MENKEFKIPIKKSVDTVKRPFSEQYNEDIESANMMNIEVEQVGTFTPPTQTEPENTAGEEFVFENVTESVNVQTPTTEDSTEEPAIDTDPFKLDKGSDFFDEENATVVNEETVEPNVEKHIYYSEGKTPVETLIIGEGVRYIRAYAFAGFSALRTVVFESDPEIEKGAFSLCPRLENVVYKYGVNPQNIFDFFGLHSSPEVKGSYNRVKINNAPEIPSAILADVTAEKVETASEPEATVEVPAETPTETPVVNTTVSEEESAYEMPAAEPEQTPTEQYTEETPDTPVTETPVEEPAPEVEQTPVTAEEPEAKKKKGGLFGLFGGRDKSAKAKDAPKKTAGLDFEDIPVSAPAPRAKTDVKELEVVPEKGNFSCICGVKSTVPTDATVIVVPNFIKIPNKHVEINRVSFDFFNELAEKYTDMKTVVLPSGIDMIENESVKLISIKRYAIEISPTCVFLKQQLENEGISVTIYNESDYYDPIP